MTKNQQCAECKATESSRFRLLKGEKWKEVERHDLVKKSYKRVKTVDEAFVKEEVSILDEADLAQKGSTKIDLTKTIKLEEFLYHTQDISKNGIRSCHKKLAHKSFFTQIQIISSLSKQSADIKCQYEYASYLDKKQLRSIKENAQNSCVLYFWADVARREEDDKSSDNGLKKHKKIKSFKNGKI
ncbi:hypothetical protein C2G38_2232595 [Gigaspora rosea]|uniref:Uncharacterized protein n=1 Tax=Gigaspora rosea TaxID=44941 RepID=A0A397U1C7_9GLOM|nr:hypothetical protein C2G38_2232595 [Gigaspora rosea]